MKTDKRTIPFLMLIVISVLLMSCGSVMNNNNSKDDNNDDQNNQGNQGATEKAPDFTHTSLDGTDYTLSDYEGKVVYLFFFGSGCPHCRDNGPITENQIYQEFKDDTSFVALGLDTWNTSASEVRSFKNVTGITYPLLLNAQETLVDYYGSAGAYDRSVVIDPEQYIAYKGTGFVNTDVDTVVDVIENELSKLKRP